MLQQQMSATQVCGKVALLSPAVFRARAPLHTAAMLLLPLLARVSTTTRTAKGNSSPSSPPPPSPAS
jgi:cell division inhibitor SulA